MVGERQEIPSFNTIGWNIEKLSDLSDWQDF